MIRQRCGGDMGWYPWSNHVDAGSNGAFLVTEAVTARRKCTRRACNGTVERQEPPDTFIQIIAGAKTDRKTSKKKYCWYWVPKRQLTLISGTSKVLMEVKASIGADRRVTVYALGSPRIHQIQGWWVDVSFSVVHFSWTIHTMMQTFKPGLRPRRSFAGVNRSLLLMMLVGLSVTVFFGYAGLEL